MSAPAPFVTVVSGLPRSGTSLMMQMLAAGGMALLVDDRRPPDADNPRGYFEFEPVKRLAEDASWVGEARGRAVKVIHALLRWLPPELEYRVLWMERPIAEVMASQRRVLEGKGRAAEAPSDARLAGLFERQGEETRAWLREQPNFEVLRVRHRDLIRGADGCVGEIAAFLGQALDGVAMRAAVEPGLHRQRQG